MTEVRIVGSEWGNGWTSAEISDSVIYFLERKYSPSAAIEWYYQYQTLYLRLMAENQMMAENKVVFENGKCSTGKAQQPGSGNCLKEFVATDKLAMENGVDETPLVGSHGITANARDPSSYSCPRCGNAYSRPHSLNRHIRFECGVEPQFECPICHKKSKHKHNLVLHMRTHQKT